MSEGVPKKTTLMEIAQDAIALEELIFEERGELNETVEKWLGEVQGSLTRKVDSYHFAMQRFESTAAMMRKRAAQFTDAARTLSNLHDSLKERIKFAMNMLELEEVKGTDFRFKKAKGKDKVIIVEKLVDPKYFTERVVRELDQEKLLEDAAKAIVEKSPLPTGITFEPSWSLRPYVNK